VTREYQTNKESPHKGLDIEAPPGTTVRAARSGKVIYADGGIPSYGLMVIIDHDDKMSTVYAHNSEILVAVGDHVRAGQAVAKVGRTGRATTDHLHFEIRRDALPVNPRNFLPKQ